MADYKIVNAEKLDADLTSIADAIRERSGDSLKIVFPAGFIDTIRSIDNELEVESLSQVHYWTKTCTVGDTIDETVSSVGTYIGNIGDVVSYADSVSLKGGSIVFVNPNSYTVTSDADAAEEVLLGKYIYYLDVFYRIPFDANIIYHAASQYLSARLGVSPAYKLSVTPGTEKQTTIIVSDDINAYPENGEQDGCTYVYQGAVNAGGVMLPTLTNPASATDLASGKELIDQNGNVVTGTLAESEVGTRIWAADDIGFYDNNVGSTKFHIGGVYSKNNIGSDTFHGFVCRPGAEFWLRNVPSSLFGDASAADVASGKTFTSAAGLLVTGTASGGGFTVTDDGEGNVTITSSAITDNNGDVVIG